MIAPPGRCTRSASLCRLDDCLQCRVTTAGRETSAHPRHQMGVALHRTWRLFLSSWIRLTKWEYWPPWLSYLPLVGWIGVQAIRHRSLVVFTGANPAIPAGGFIGESKIAILEGLWKSRDRVARSEL